MLRQPYRLMLRETERWLTEKKKSSASRFDVALKADLILGKPAVPGGC